MSFYVEKLLATGRFRFAARRRRELASIEDDPMLSTGPSGEFIRQRSEIFYSADHRPIRKAELPQSKSIATTPFTVTMIDGTRRGWIFLGLMIFGALLVLIGFSVLVTKGAAGWIEVILGAAMIATPVVLTARKRRAVKAVEDRRRAERAEQEARDRELLAGYSDALDRLREKPGDDTLLALRREREKLDLPYAIWGDAARSTVLQVGFNMLARVGPEGAGDIATLMDRSSSAAGLVAEDALGVKHALYSTVLWHFLADDRLGTVQKEIVRTIQSGLGIKAGDLPVDDSSEEQFERLRGVDHRSVPKCDAKIQLTHREFCIYTTAGEPLEGDGSTNLIVTNKRLVVEGARGEEIPIASIDEIEVDADTSVVTVTATERKRPLQLRIGEPIFFASLLSLATTLDERPKSFM